jgi:ABC-2 type transport system permease protein
VSATAAGRAPGRPFAHFAGVVRFEYCKFRSVRSTLWTLAAGVVFNVLTAVLLAIFLPRALGTHAQETADPTRLSLGGMHLSQVAFAVLGVLFITGEYATGQIRSTLSAVPKRRMMLAAKTVVFCGATVVIGLLSTFAAYLLFQVLLPSGSGLRSSLSDPGVLRALTGGGLFLVVLGLLGLGLGTIIRSSAGTVALLLGLLFVPPLILSLLPVTWQNTVGPYLPLEAGFAIISTHHTAGSLQPWPALGLVGIYAAAALVIAFAQLNHRDA